jgi:hypothetical protein
MLRITKKNQKKHPTDEKIVVQASGLPLHHGGQAVPRTRHHQVQVTKISQSFTPLNYSERGKFIPRGKFMPKLFRSWFEVLKKVWGAQFFEQVQVEK